VRHQINPAWIVLLHTEYSEIWPEGAPIFHIVSLRRLLAYLLPPSPRTTAD
jgi:hypothetical protein